MSGEMRNFTIEAPGKTLTKDLGDGRGLKATVFGANFDQKIGDWSISNKFNRFDGDLNTIAMFTGNNPLSMSDYINAAIANGNAAVVAAAGGQLATRAPPPSSRAARSRQPAGGASRPVGGGEAAEILHRRTARQQGNLQGNTVTVGGYFADYSSHDVWYRVTAT
jgi:hypothetical protein